MKYFLLVILCCLSFSCTTLKIVEVPTHSSSIEYINLRDSVYTHDSVFCFIESKNDTVFINKYKEKIKKVYVADTILKIDTIPIVTLIEKPIITNKLYNWQKGLIYLGILSLVFLIYKILKIIHL